ncbi:MAG TPA: TonB-dependent receptor [Steroidobacter sp.]|uniref:TonB-dependent receptor n=1 Tax=Steroidobacter sp. TaxID=1978227 RepID=UPI002ED9D2C9
MTTRRNKLLAAAVLCTLGAIGSVANAQSNYEFNLPPQPLADALRAIGSQTTTNILFDPETVENLTAPALRGTLSPEEAIKLVLAGTKLVVQQTAANSIVIAPARDKVTSISLRNLADDGSQLRLAQAEAAQQSASAEERDDDSASVVIQEIIVTAQKRDERLIDVPMSVSVLSGSEIVATGMTQFRDFAATVPGLSFMTSGANSTQVTLRGVTAGTDIGATVGTLVDDVPYSTLSATRSLDLGLADVERIEVLRGPQGTLYGASTMGGLIKYVSVKPDPTRFSGKVLTSVSSVEDGGVGYSASGAVNIPLGDAAALRVSGFYSDDGGYIDNVALDKEDVNATNVDGGRVDFLYQPSEAFSIRLAAFTQTVSRDGEGTTDYTFQGKPIYGELDQSRALAEPSESKYQLYTGTIAYDFGPATLTSITGYQENDLEYVQDLTHAPTPNYLAIIRALLGPNFSALGQQQWGQWNKLTQEIRLASDGSSRLEWLAGVFYTRENFWGGTYWDTLDLAGNPTTANVLDFRATNRYEEYAGFGDLTWHFTDKFDVTVGMRYAHDKQNTAQSPRGLFGSGIDTAGGSEENVKTYLANARYHFNDRNTVYARYATGFRPGGPNYPRINVTTGTTTPTAPFDPDDLKSYELGYKAETSDRRFGIDAAIFYIDWSDIKINRVVGGFGFTDNATNGATVKGAELALTLRPLQQLKIATALAYQDATLDEDEPAFGGRAGEFLPAVPRFSGGLSADYQFAGQWDPRVGASVNYVGERNAVFDNSVPYVQYVLPSYTNVDARGGLTLRNVDLQLFVRNVTNERAVFSALNWRGTGMPAISQPRTIGVSALARF